MSVFQLQDCWSVRLGDDEEFGCDCMAVGNFDNSHPSSDKIAVGSFSGMLRIYNPTKAGYRVEDLIYEDSLDSPILQLLSGKFLPSSPTNVGLAVLHPRKLSVYELLPQFSVTSSKVSHYSLTRVYQHMLGDEDGKHFTACSMISGFFGGQGRNREMLLVQSMDGKVQIFDHSVHMFTRQFVDCLIPGPMIYLPKVDSLVHCNYACRVECYKYHVLTSLQHDIKSTDKLINDQKESKSNTSSNSKAGGIIGVKNTIVDWSVNVGESVRQVARGNYSQSGKSEEILVLCDRSLFVLKDNGGILQQRRLEHDSMCMYSYTVAGKDGGPNKNAFIIASTDGTLQVYCDLVLQWSAKVPNVPIQIAVGEFGEQKGMIVTLDENGMLTVGCLGTKPSFNVISSLSAETNSSRDINYEKIDEEHRALLQIIRESQSDRKREFRDKLVARINIAKAFDKDVDPVLMESFANSGHREDLVTIDQGGDSQKHLKICVKLYLSYSGDTAIHSIVIVPNVPGFVHPSPLFVNIESMSGSRSTPQLLKFYLYAKNTVVPSDLNASFMITYVAANSESRVLNVPFQIPFWLSCKPRTATKQAKYKFTVGAEKANNNGAKGEEGVADMVQLTELFDDYLYAFQESGFPLKELFGAAYSNFAMGFEFWSNSYPFADKQSAPLVNASILLSKQTGRYRIQSDYYEGAYVLISFLEKSLRSKLGGSGGAGSKDTNETPVNVMFTENLPLEDYFSIINNHFHIRTQIKSLLSDLEYRSFQFRALQKRLLVRYKDKNPVPLNGVDAMFEDTYRTLLSVGDQVEQLQNERVKIDNDLYQFGRLLVLLAGLKFGMSGNDRRLLESYLCPVISGQEQGWEEIVETSTAYLLRTALAKNAKESVALNNAVMELPTSTERLLKHITLVFDRLGKGGRLVVSSTPSNANSDSKDRK